MVCAANFEPQIQVKSKAVDTGRNPSFAHFSAPMKGRTHYGHGVDSPKSFACAMKKESGRSGSADFVRLAVTSADALNFELARAGSASHLVFFCALTMETLDNTAWDVLIVGTGLQQSLLALYVLSMSGGVVRL